jgi:hypothetical protein
MVIEYKVITMEVDSMLEKDFWKGQLEDVKIQEIKEQIKEEKLRDSVLMTKERYGTRSVSVFPK